jgi:type IV secretory pathway VirB2 component (pilin)
VRRGGSRARDGSIGAVLALAFLLAACCVAVFGRDTGARLFAVGWIAEFVVSFLAAQFVESPRCAHCGRPVFGEDDDEAGGPPAAGAT